MCEALNFCPCLKYHRFGRFRGLGRGELSCTSWYIHRPLQLESGRRGGRHRDSSILFRFVVLLFLDWHGDGASDRFGGGKGGRKGKGGFGWEKKLGFWEDKNIPPLDGYLELISVIFRCRCCRCCRCCCCCCRCRCRCLCRRCYSTCCSYSCPSSSSCRCYSCRRC